METYRNGIFFVHLRVFKSYYVVWKQKVATKNTFWSGMFKSYYVVWKPDDIASIDRVLPSLNRTM